MTDATKTQNPDPADAERLRNQAYYSAKRDLVEKYQDEYRKLVLAYAEELGVEIRFRKSPAERAEEQMQKLLAEHPELRSKFTEG